MGLGLHRDAVRGMRGGGTDLVGCRRARVQAQHKVAGQFPDLLVARPLARGFQSCGRELFSMTAALTMVRRSCVNSTTYALSSPPRLSFSRRAMRMSCFRHLSGHSRSRKLGGFCRGKRHDQEVKRDKGADRLRCIRSVKRAAEIDGEKRTDAQYVTGGHK